MAYTGNESKTAEARAAAAPYKVGDKVKAAGHIGRIVYIDGYGNKVKYLVEVPPTESRYGREVYFTGKFLERAA